MPPRSRGARIMWAWAPVLAWCVLIFCLSHTPNLRITQAWWDIIVRKIAHMVEYAILARLLCRAMTQTTLWPWRKIFWTAMAAALLYAMSDEYHQTFVVGRVGAVHDVVIDGLGVWIGLGFVP